MIELKKNQKNKYKIFILNNNVKLKKIFKFKKKNQKSKNKTKLLKKYFKELRHTKIRYKISWEVYKQS
jgi:hypothetical protein